MRKKILVLTQKVDPHVEPVAQEIQRRNRQVIRFDFGDFPDHVQLVAPLGLRHWNGTLRYADAEHALDEFQSIWWRRPNTPQAAPGYDMPTRAFLNRENLRGFIGVLQQQGEGQDGFFWVSKRDRIQSAEFKPYQLQEAQALGLDIPRTLVTNSPSAARRFYDECNSRMIVKAVGKGAVDPNNVQDFGDERFIYTSQVTHEDLDELDGVRVCAHLFQERIAKVMDLRVVVIGRRVFTIGIHASQEHHALDWRIDYSTLTYSIEHLPAEVEHRALALVRAFGLQFSSMDFVLSPEGKYIFIELNPNGQFLWLSPPTGLPMAAAMADLLCFPQEYRL